VEEQRVTINRQLNSFNSACMGCILMHANKGKVYIMDVKEMDVVADVTRHLEYWLGQASYEHVREGMTWYQRQHNEMRRLADTYNVPIEVACGVTATLSPRVSWPVNLAAAEGILATGAKKMLNGKCTPGYSKNTDKALKIFHTHDLSLVTGKKVPHFYETLLNPEYREVTVYQWMARAGGFLLDWGVSPSVRIIRVVQHCVMDIARRRGLSPHQIQAIIWCSIKDRRDWKAQGERLGALMF
jgi:hypothetical protein